jgi:uncharacterized protein
VSQPPTFAPPDAFVQDRRAYRLLPFRFIDVDGGRVLVNEAGEHVVVTRELFQALVSHDLVPDSREYQDFKSKHFLHDSASPTPISLLATKYRTKRSFLAGFTKLHLFVVTLRCDHSCQYCQVSRVSMDREKFDMSWETAERSLDLVFRSPARHLKIEFQGGEPLLNFELIQRTVLAAEERNREAGRNLRFVITSNLAFLTDEMLDFMAEHDIHLSTSVDGPAFIHNANRPRPGRDAYERTIEGIEHARAVLGADAVAATMTTSRLSLEHPQEIVDEYVARGLGCIFLRPLSPYGFAARTRRRTGYEMETFLKFYRAALDRVIEHNREGRPIVEAYAQLLLTKILTPFPTGYVDLQSPAGAGIGAAVYNYDGDVYVSDEARMLAEMGDTSFRLGNVHTDTYEALFGGPLLRSVVAASCVEALPGCSECAFQSWCGADPVENHATQGSMFGHRPTSSFCGRNMGIIKHLLGLYHSGDAFVRELFWSWVQRAPLEELLPVVPD